MPDANETGKGAPNPVAAHAGAGLGIAIGVWWAGGAYQEESASKVRNSGSETKGAAATPPPGFLARASDITHRASGWAKGLLGAYRMRSVSDAASLHLLYVTAPGTSSCLGVSSRLFATREAPFGESAKLTSDVGEEMQASFEEGLRYVRKLPRDWEHRFSIRLSFEDRGTKKDGGSAGAAFTLAMLSAIQEIPIDPEVAMTGDLSIDGSVQPVGGVVDKLRGALRAKCRFTLIPIGNARNVTDLAIIDGTSPLWDMQVFSVKTIDEAMGIARKDREEKLRTAIEKFDALRARLPAVVTPNYLWAPEVQAGLKEVVQLTPNHLTAAALLKATQNQLPKYLSLSRSVDEITSACSLFIQGAASNGGPMNIGAAFPGGTTPFPEYDYGASIKALNSLAPLLDPRSLELKSACMEYMAALRAVWSFRAAPSSYSYSGDPTRRFYDARARLATVARKFTTDKNLHLDLMEP